MYGMNTWKFLQTVLQGSALYKWRWHVNHNNSCVRLYRVLFPMTKYETVTSYNSGTNILKREKDSTRPLTYTRRYHYYRTNLHGDVGKFLFRDTRTGFCSILKFPY